jgi:serine/threonine protein kinase
VQLIHLASNGRVVMPKAFYDSPIRLEPYQLIAWIGRGHFGEAHLAVRPRDFATNNLTWEGKTCKELFLAKVPKWVVKLFKEGNDDERSVALHVSREVKALKHLVAYDREVAVAYDCKVADKDHASALVFEYCNGGDLKTFIEWISQNGQDISEFEVLSLTKQLVDALLALKAAHILHNDVAPRNVFLHWEPDPFGEHWELVLKLGDFGLSVDLGDKKTATGRHKYSGHIAPEIAANVPYDEQADSYALGVVMYELMTGKLVNLLRYGVPWEESKRRDMEDQLEKGLLVHRFPSLLRIARELTMRQPSDRPRLESVLAELNQLETQVPKTGTRRKSSIYCICSPA